MTSPRAIHGGNAGATAPPVVPAPVSLPAACGGIAAGASAPDVPAAKPYYEDDAVTIYHGDCLDVLPTLPAADLIFTSPPYNLGVSVGGGFGHGTNWKGKWGAAARDSGLGNGYTDHADDMPLAEYEAWQRDVLRACWAQLNGRGAIFYNHKPRVQERTLWTPLTVNPDLPVRQIIIWARAGGINFAPTHYCPTHEWIVVFAKPDFRLTSKGASGVGDVWRIPAVPSDHPAPFPLGLPAMAIETTGPSLVVDPFMGSGTTLRAAKDAGVRAIGIEISERYCEMAAKRCAQDVLDLAPVSEWRREQLADWRDDARLEMEEQR